MKVICVLLATMATAAAFAPAPANSRTATELQAKKVEKKPFFRTVFEMDLFAPNPDVNDYGARNKKKLAVGKITDSSYVPAGLSKAEYEKIRAADIAKKNAQYQKNVAKAGRYTDFTNWYIKRGTDTTDGWIKSATRGHSMTKTKYDFSGKKNEVKTWDGTLN